MKNLSQTSIDATSALNLRRLFILRNIAISFEIGIIGLAYWVLAIPLPVFPLLVIIAAQGLINGFTWLRMKRPGSVSSWEFFSQLVMDSMILAALLYFTGGYTNAFVSLFLLPLVTASTLLPQGYAWAMAAITTSSYTLLMFFYRPLPHNNMDHTADFNLHVLGMWFGFLLSAGLIVFFLVRMANSLRERDRILTATREKILRDQHLVALGTLATGAAHELGTPLTTMAVLASEMKREHSDNVDIVEKMDMLRGQLDRCKHILSDITASTGQVRPEGGQGLSIDTYIRNVIDDLQNLRPEAKLNCEFQGAQPAPYILADKTLSQALINVLDNAADASTDNIDVEVAWDNKTLSIVVGDRGEEISPAVQAAAGTAFFTTKQDGHGLGLYLAHAVIERFDGELQLVRREGGGNQAVIKLPLSTIRVPS
ncbi:MAG: ATP-binding protein [Pseudomonadota bacterium]|nr:ATP-binding protein [Pseudomonadota bacterium]